MSEQEQAEHLLATVRHRLSGPEMETLERITEHEGIPIFWDDERQDWFSDSDCEDTLTRLCTEFAEIFK
jgi:hypothetical protein